MMPSGIESKVQTVIMKGSGDVEQNTAEKTENETPRYTDTQPNKTSTTNIACRTIKCAGKVLLCLFTVPIMVVVEMLFGLISGVASVYHSMVIPTWKENKACALCLSVTVIAPCAVMIGGLNVVGGFVFGLLDGIDIAFNLSLTPLRQSWTDLKKALSGEQIKELAINDQSKAFLDYVINGKPLEPEL